MESEWNCVVCKKGTFQSRTDWLFHVVLANHSKRVLRHFQRWHESRTGDRYVITGLEKVENSLLLEYLAQHLTSFTDIVFFKPKANVALLVGDAREFSRRSHRIAGQEVTVKAYNDMDPVEWKSYFGQDVVIAGMNQAQNNETSTAPPPTQKRKRDKHSSSEQQNPSKMSKVNNARPPPPPPQPVPPPPPPPEDRDGAKTPPIPTRVPPPPPEMRTRAAPPPPRMPVAASPPPRAAQPPMNNSRRGPPPPAPRFPEPPTASSRHPQSHFVKREPREPSPAVSASASSSSMSVSSVNEVPPSPRISDPTPTPVSATARMARAPPQPQVAPSTSSNPMKSDPPAPPPLPFISPGATQYVKKWQDEMDEIHNSIFMTSVQIDARKSVITHLTDMFKATHPQCRVVPMGPDILGYTFGQDQFQIYFDRHGYTSAGTVPPGTEPRVEIVAEEQKDIDKIRTPVYQKLKALEGLEITRNVQCSGANVVMFTHVLFDVKCKLYFKPFMLAQTARLCRHLYSMSDKAIALLNLVVYWTQQQGPEFRGAGLTNPYVMYWLVFVYLQTTKDLPPVSNLQRSCALILRDRDNNVAFACTDFSNPVEMRKSPRENTAANVQLLAGWFAWMNNTWGQGANQFAKGHNCRHTLLCPRFNHFIDKRMFKVIWETYRNNKKHVTSQQKKTRQYWTQNLIDIGFTVDTWEGLLGLKLPDTLCIQHPLYLMENVSMAFDGPFGKRFFTALKQTHERLVKLLAGGQGETSLVQVLKPK